jgi:hypothetical protein
VGSIPASNHGGRARILYLWWYASPGAAADQPGVQDWYIPLRSGVPLHQYLPGLHVSRRNPPVVFVAKTGKSLVSHGLAARFHGVLSHDLTGRVSHASKSNDLRGIPASSMRSSLSEHYIQISSVRLRWLHVGTQPTGSPPGAFCHKAKVLLKHSAQKIHIR